MGYVVNVVEHLRDGTEYHAKLFHTIDEAMAYIDRVYNEVFAGCNYSFQLFQLSREIKLESKEVVEEKEVVKKKVRRFNIVERDDVCSSSPRTKKNKR